MGFTRNGIKKPALEFLLAFSRRYSFEIACLIGAAVCLGLFHYLNLAVFHENPGSAAASGIVGSSGAGILLPVKNVAGGASRTIYPPDDYATFPALSPDLVFTWEAGIPALFQVSGRPDFSSEIIIEEETCARGSRGRYLPPGVYYWRVLPLAPNGAQSAAGSMSPPSRLIVLPGFNSPGTSLSAELFSNPAGRGPSADHPIILATPPAGAVLAGDHPAQARLSWKMDGHLQNPRVIFSHYPEPAWDPGAVVHYAGQDSGSMDLPRLGEGVWYWTVEGETPEGQSASAAFPHWFTVLPLHPLNSPGYARPDDEIVITLHQLTVDRCIAFEWEQVDGANAYIFSLFGNDSRRELLHTTAPIPDTFFTLTDLAILDLDDYTWQVEAVSVSRNGTIERRGKIRQFSFSIDITSSDSLRTRSQGTLYGS